MSPSMQPVSAPDAAAAYRSAAYETIHYDEHAPTEFLPRSDHYDQTPNHMPCLMDTGASSLPALINP